MPKTPAPEPTEAPTRRGRKPGAESTPVPKLDFSQPIWVVMHQTLSRNNWQTFASEVEARDYAAETAQNGDHHVALWGPQIMRFMRTPPAVPQATALPLAWGGVSEAAE